MQRAQAPASQTKGANMPSPSFISDLNSQLAHEIRKCNRLDLVIDLISRGVDINSRGTSGWTPLMYAARNSRFEIAKFLIERGARINELDDHGRTALGYAVLRGNVRMVELLIDNGADMTLRDSMGADLIRHAKFWGFRDTVALLERKLAEMIEALDTGKAALKRLHRSS